MKQAVERDRAAVVVELDTQVVGRLHLLLAQARPDKEYLAQHPLAQCKRPLQTYKTYFYNSSIKHLAAAVGLTRLDLLVAVLVVVVPGLQQAVVLVVLAAAVVLVPAVWAGQASLVVALVQV